MKKILLLLWIIVSSCGGFRDHNTTQLNTKGIIWQHSKGMINNYHVNDSLFRLYKVGDKIKLKTIYANLKKR